MDSGCDNERAAELRREGVRRSGLNFARLAFVGDRNDARVGVKAPAEDFLRFGDRWNESMAEMALSSSCTSRNGWIDTLSFLVGWSCGPTGLKKTDDASAFYILTRQSQGY